MTGQTKPNFRPSLRSRFESKSTNNTIIVNELVWFVPDITIKCQPPYIKGKQDSTWVRYRKGNRPKNKEDWQNVLGMTIQTML
jgi:hypothetical protein